MSTGAFESHLRDPAPGFVCEKFPASEGDVDFVARVRHDVGEPASEKALARLDAILGAGFADVRRFFSLHDGVLLYQDVHGEAAGIRFFPVLEWDKCGEEMRDGFEAMGMDLTLDETGLLKGLCIGEVPQSGNYFTLRVEEPSPGCVYYVDHDDWRDDPIAPSFCDFLELIVRDPAAFLYNVGCFVRFVDPQSRREGIPSCYISDVSRK